MQGMMGWRGNAAMALVALVAAASCSSPESVRLGAFGSEAAAAVAIVDLPKLPPPMVEVPNVVGMSIQTARTVLRQAGLHAWVVRLEPSKKPRGTVLVQALEPGTSVRPKRGVRLTIAKPVPPPPCGVFRNPWCYDFVGGSYISRPPADFCLYFPCISSFWTGHGYVIQCVDGQFSKSGGISGSCSYHGGNWRYLYA